MTFDLKTLFINRSINIINIHETIYRQETFLFILIGVIRSRTQQICPLLIPAVPPGSFITTQISPVSAIGGAGPGYWLGHSGSCSSSVSTGRREERREEREGDILVKW